MQNEEQNARTVESNFGCHMIFFKIFFQIWTLQPKLGVEHPSRGPRLNVLYDFYFAKAHKEGHVLRVLPGPIEFDDPLLTPKGPRVLLRSLV
jgi:hypothetical protein